MACRAPCCLNTVQVAHCQNTQCTATQAHVSCNMAPYPDSLSSRTHARSWTTTPYLATHCTRVWLGIGIQLFILERRTRVLQLLKKFFLSGAHLHLSLATFPSTFRLTILCFLRLYPPPSSHSPTTPFNPTWSPPISTPFLAHSKHLHPLSTSLSICPQNVDSSVLPSRAHTYASACVRLRLRPRTITPYYLHSYHAQLLTRLACLHRSRNACAEETLFQPI